MPFGIPWKLVGYGAGLVVISLLLWAGYNNIYNRGAAEGRAVAEEALRERDVALTSLRASQAASEGYANELEDLRSAARPDPVIRLCPTNRPVPVSRPAAGTDGPAPSSGDVQGEPGQDIGPALAREADRADRLAAQLRALQEWIRAVGGEKGSTQ